ncbi:hypothetical protein LTR94_025934, partial [Friedmanniomyces endolithicus]
VAANPDNHDKRFALANAQMAAGDRDGAADNLLHIVAADRSWNEDAARQQLLKLNGGVCPPSCSDERRTMSNVTRLSIFPLPGALLFPGLHLPLHIFEPRYRAMVSDAMARDRRIAMIQPRPDSTDRDRPALFDVGCVGRIAEVDAYAAAN